VYSPGATDRAALPNKRLKLAARVD